MNKIIKNSIDTNNIDEALSYASNNQTDVYILGVIKDNKFTVDSEGDSFGGPVKIGDLVNKLISNDADINKYNISLVPVVSELNKLDEINVKGYNFTYRQVIERGRPSQKDGDGGDKSIQPSTYTSGKLASVIEMQKAIRDFALVLIPTADTSSKYSVDAREEGKTYEAKKSIFLPSSGLAQFFVSQYIKDPAKTMSFSMDPKQKELKQKQLKPSLFFNTIQDTLKRIGGASNEQKPDGIWGPRTLAAVKNVYQLATALLTFSKDMGYSGDVKFDDAALQRFQQALPAENITDPSRQMSAKEQNERADTLADSIRLLTNFSRYLVDYLTEKFPQYQQNLEFETTTPTKIDPKSFGDVNVNIDYNNEKIIVPLNSFTHYTQLQQALGKDNTWMKQNFTKFIQAARTQAISQLQQPAAQPASASSPAAAKPMSASLIAPGPF